MIEEQYPDLSPEMRAATEALYRFVIRRDGRPDQPPPDHFMRGWSDAARIIVAAYLSARPDDRPHPLGIELAAVKVRELREAMSLIQLPHPGYRPGAGPTAADNCAEVFQFMLRQLDIYLGVQS